MPPNSLSPTFAEQVLQAVGPQLDDAINFDPDPVVVLVAAGLKGTWQLVHAAELAARRILGPAAAHGLRRLVRA